MRFLNFCVLLLLFNCFSFNKSNAQVLRIKGGVNVSTVGGDAQGNKYKVGFHGGIAGELPLSDDTYAQPELVVSGQGARPSEYVTSNYWYVNLPFLFAYKTPKYTLQAGPQVGLLLGASIKNKDTGSIEVATEHLNKVDVALAMGIELPLNSRFAVQGRYNYGISNTAGHNAIGDLKVYNRVIQLSFIMNVID